MPAEIKTLTDLRGRLHDIVRGAWSVKEAEDFKHKLEKIFPDDLKAKYRDCIDGPTPRDCLRKVAAEGGLSDLFEDTWAEAPPELIRKLETVRTAWTATLRDVLVKVVAKLDIPELYALCMAGDFAEVVTRAGLPEEPKSFRECATAVAKIKKLKSELRTAWGKK